MRVTYASLAIVGLLALGGCGKNVLTLSSFDGSQSTSIEVEIADSPSEREIGLMNRAKLENDKGMFFAFKEPQMLIFWMKDTLIPLEVIFFDQNGEFVNSLEMMPCIADPCDLFKASALSQYALETNPGFRKLHGIGTGWKIDLDEVKGMAKPK